MEIGENIRLVENVLYDIENKNNDAIILMLDMEKAFDRVEWGWLFKVLAHFNFLEKDLYLGWWLFTNMHNAAY